MENKISAAIVLFVKNEVDNIVDWISWHLAIGFEKIFIYDDHSEDGTYEVCLEASKIFNIEVNRSNVQKETDFFWRQKQSYFDACIKTKGYYDWVAFIDADEYIYLEKEKNITTFLNNYEDCNAIALNRCIYGSSKRVIKDHIPVYESFNYHSNEHLNDNRLVKSIIRPEDYSFHYRDPHRWLMNNEVYKDSCGNIVQWDNSTKNIIWKNARINHYICRSMENYIERIKRRLGSDLHNSTVYWDYFNRNEIYEVLRKDLCDNAYEINIKIKKHCVYNYINNERIKNLILNKGHSIDKNLKTYYIKTKYNKYLCLNNIDGNLVQSENIIQENFKIKCIFLNGLLVIFREKNNTILNIYFNIKEDLRRSYCYIYNVEIDNSSRMFLRSPKTNKYLCFIPVENGGEVVCNRDEKSDWEEFFLEPCNDNFDFKVSNLSILDFNSFKDYINSGYNINYNDFIMNISNLNKTDKNKVIYESNNTIGWIL